MLNRITLEYWKTKKTKKNSKNYRQNYVTKKEKEKGQVHGQRGAAAAVTM